MAEYIEREKFKNILESKAEMAFGTSKAFFYSVVKMLELIPAADVVEVKHGEWITPTKIKGMNIAVPHCSLCGNVPCDKALYCPYCGAKMDGKGD